MEYAKALKIANRLHELFAPHCIITNIAGSIRRQCYDIGDIELVCLPRYQFLTKDLFGNGEWVLPKAYLDVLDTIQEKVIKGAPYGRMMQIKLKGTNLLLDLFTPQLHDYFRILAIRTGSADYAHLRLAAQCKRLGWCGTHDGLRMISECLEITPGHWRCIKTKPTLPPAWKSEEEFFEWLQMPWENPIYREVTPRQKTFLKEDQ